MSLTQDGRIATMKDPISGRRRLVLTGLVVVGVSTIIFVRFDSRDDDGNFEFERYVGGSVLKLVEK